MCPLQTASVRVWGMPCPGLLPSGRHQRRMDGRVEMSFEISPLPISGCVKVNWLLQNQKITQREHRLVTAVTFCYGVKLNILRVLSTLEHQHLQWVEEALS